MRRFSIITILCTLAACTETPKTSSGNSNPSSNTDAAEMVPDNWDSWPMDASETTDSSPMSDSGEVPRMDSGVYPDAMMPVIDSGVPEDSGGHPDAMIPPPPFTFYTPAWMDGGTVPTQHTCNGPLGWTGQNNPELIWENPPAGTAAFVMIFDDPPGNPSAWGPNTTGWRHWAFYTADATVVSIPPSTSNTANLPSGVTELRSGDQRVGYVPNCPPSPPSSYRWRIWAVNTANLGVNANSSFAQLEQAAENAKIESLQFVGVAY